MAAVVLLVTADSRPIPLSVGKGISSQSATASYRNRLRYIGFRYLYTAIGVVRQRKSLFPNRWQIYHAFSCRV